MINNTKNILQIDTMIFFILNTKIRLSTFTIYRQQGRLPDFFVPPYFPPEYPCNFIFPSNY